MAEDRTFTLIGNFTDNITGPLTKINNSVSRLKNSLSELSKVTQPLKSDFKSLGALSKNFSSSLKGQATDVKNMTAALRGLAAQAKRTNSAMKLGAGRRARGGGGGIPGMPPGGGGGGRPPRGGGGGGYASAVFGNQLGNMMSGAVIKGFEVGVTLMQKPFQAFASALGERISDEMGDLQAAGGIFSISKRSKDPFVKNFDQAISFQQEMNLSMAKMANSLPGSTQDFVNVQKRLTDTIARIVTKDVKGSTRVSNEIRSTEEGKKYYGGQLSSDVTTKAGQSKLMRDNINTMSGELTKLTVLAGLTGGPGGSGGGVRGPMGPYGLPGLSERMLSDETISMGGMQRYAAIFRDPTVKDALERHIPKLNAAIKGTPERFTAFIDMMKEIVTPELVAKLRRSVSGINESIRSTFFSPESGFLGLGRKLKDMGPMFNDFGQAVDANGEVVKGMTEAAKANLGLYEMLRDIYANTAVALMPVIEGMGSIFDPLQAVGNTLKEARIMTAKFLENFNFYRNSLEKYANDLGGLSGKQLTEGLDLRAALMNINNLFRGLGIFTSKEFEDTTNLLLDPSFNPAQLISKMVKEFFSSEAATALGEQIGTTIGTVFKELSSLMSSLADGLGTDLGPGFGRGFKEAGGFAAIQNIFVQLLKMFFSAFATFVKEMPMVAFVGAGLALAPALIGAASTALMEGLLTGSIGGGRGRRGRGGGAGGIGGFLGPTTAMKGARGAAGAAIAPAGAAVKTGIQGLGKLLPGIAKLGPVIGGLGKVAKFIPGGAILGGAVDFGLAKATGQSTGKAIAGAVGSVLGGTLGSVLGPLGTIGGSILGGMAGDAIHKAFSPQGRMQENAAALQKQAADLQLAAADKQKLTDKYGIPELNNNYGQSADLNKRIEALGYAADKSVIFFKKEYFERNNAAEKLKAANIALEEAQRSYTALKLPPDELKKRLAPLEASALGAADSLKKEQTQLNAAVAKIPYNIQTAIVDNVRNVSMQGVADALALKVAQINSGAVDWANSQLKLPTSSTNPFAVSQKTNSFGIPTTPPKKGGYQIPAEFRYDGKSKPTSSLSNAISSEMRNKPSGSNLVIANSSETVIPAAGGYGVKELMDILVDGFSSIKNQYTSLATGVNDLDKKTTKEFQTVNTTIDNNQNQNQQEFTKINQNFQQLSTKVSSMSVGGMGGTGGLGAGYGSAGGQIAGQLGNFIKQTGGAPGSIHEHPQHGGVKGRHSPGSYHYQGRAIDIGGYANEQAGILSRIAQFNAQYGVKPVELFHAGNDPAGHSDHVHVAYAYGAGNPAFFNSQRKAEQWEKSMVPGSMKVGSITGNSGEGFGSSSINVVNNISISQQSGQSADELASIVAMKIGDAVAEARAASIFV